MAEFRGYNALDTMRRVNAQGGGFLQPGAIAGEVKGQNEAASKYTPKKGDERYGFVKFGEGPSLSNPSFQRRYGQTLGAGLWSAGINPDDPQAEQKARAMLSHLLNSGNPNYQTGVWGDQTWGRDDAKMPGVRQLLAKDPNMSAKALLDYAYRAPQMQNALKPNDIGEQIGITLGEVALGVMTGGAAVPAMMAAAYAGANGGDLLDVALAGLGGYSAGTLGAGIGSGIGAAGGVGNYLTSIPGKVGGYFSDLGGNLASGVSNGVNWLRGDGALTSLNSGGVGLPSWVQKGAEAGLPGAVRGASSLVGGFGSNTSGAGGVATGGGGMSDWLTNTLKWANDTLGVSGGDLLRAGGDLLSGYLNTQAIKDATKAQTGAIDRASDLTAAATRDQLALMERMFNKQLELQEPFRQGGLAGQNKLLDLLGLSGNTKAPGYGSETKPFTYSLKDFRADPGYNFRMSEGLKALDQQAAARGGLISGNALKASQAYGQNMASDEYQRAYGRSFDRFFANRNSRLNPLQSLAGMGQTTTNALAGAAGDYGQNASNVIGQGANTQGNLAIKAGDVRGSSYLGNQNTWNTAITNALSRPGQSADAAFMRQIMQRMAGAA